MSDEIQRTLGRIEGQLLTNSSVLEGLNEKLGRHFDDDREFQTSVSDRLGKIEKKVWWFSGVGAAVALFFGRITGKF